MRVAFAGDWHGNSQYAVKAITYAHEQGVEQIYHVGDFGIWPGSRGARYIHKIERTCKTYDIPVVVTLGNHDDWNQVENKLKRDSYAFFTDNILLAPRVGVVDNFLHVAGAVSVDQGIRIAGINWWSQEALTEADQYTANEIGQQKIDVVVTHDSPAGALLELDDPPDFWLPYIPAAEENRVRLAHIISTIIGDSTPILVHGHYHFRSIQAEVNIEGGGHLKYVHGMGHDYGAVQDNVMIVDL